MLSSVYSLLIVWWAKLSQLNILIFVLLSWKVTNFFSSSWLFYFTREAFYNDWLSLMKLLYIMKSLMWFRSGCCSTSVVKSSFTADEGPPDWLLKDLKFCIINWYLSFLVSWPLFDEHFLVDLFLLSSSDSTAPKVIRCCYSEFSITFSLIVEIAS